ncbi:unnamed protein product (macronuclear) [Paramecium tetraurelia]|uniref:PX domain-containing protein n=1 Tax=Paramecium tetraurelia TaxID=5888 RepID=A0D653_PARTE|nr:uncharacterized protein GSPATT00013950001 [Paramecium tetraurelia]CAK78520.1 unnamed protein product [Paramecium tetraurelia]|eukprot:XP_001445917.1 hypothetical protein (macronuclear) [Paramecium tetraurelia strain d4-2]
MISSISSNSEQNLDQNNLPILSFLNNQRKRSIQYVKFKMQTVKVYKNFACYQVEVNEQGKIWIMEIRYSTLQQFYQKLKEYYDVKLTFPGKLFFGNLCPNNLKKRAIGIQQFLQELGSNYQLINSEVCSEFLAKQQHYGTHVIDLTEQEEFELDA